MIRLIYLCMAFIAISFIAVPVYFGIADEKDKLAEQYKAQDIAKTAPEDSLTFEEIYALAEEASSNPEDLNNIATAAGGPPLNENFSSGFSMQTPTALKDPSPSIIIEVADDKIMVVE
jgi:hypothetical protein